MRISYTKMLLVASFLVCVEVGATDPREDDRVTMTPSSSCRQDVPTDVGDRELNKVSYFERVGSYFAGFGSSLSKMLENLFFFVRSYQPLSSPHPRFLTKTVYEWEGPSLGQRGYMALRSRIEVEESFYQRSQCVAVDVLRTELTASKQVVKRLEKDLKKQKEVNEKSAQEYSALEFNYNYLTMQYNSVLKLNEEYKSLISEKEEEIECFKDWHERDQSQLLKSLEMCSSLTESVQILTAELSKNTSSSSQQLSLRTSTRIEEADESEDDRERKRILTLIENYLNTKSEFRRKGIRTILPEQTKQDLMSLVQPEIERK